MTVSLLLKLLLVPTLVVASSVAGRGTGLTFAAAALGALTVEVCFVAGPGRLPGDIEPRTAAVRSGR